MFETFTFFICFLLFLCYLSPLILIVHDKVFKLIFQISSVSPLAVQYYNDAGHNMWSLEDPQYQIDQGDIICGLAHPTWATKGSRLFYIFNV